MRESGTLYWLLSDHLGSQAVTAYDTGGLKAQVRYRAFGEDRYGTGTMPTTYRYTGQRQESYINIYYYGARWYDQTLGRFIQPDTIIPQQDDPQQLNRFSYARNNPTRYTDPTGHWLIEDDSANPKFDKSLVPANYASYYTEKEVQAVMRVFAGEGVLGEGAFAVEGAVLRNRVDIGFGQEDYPDANMHSFQGQSEHGVRTAAISELGEWESKARSAAVGVVWGTAANPMTENPDATYFSHSRCEAEHTYYETEIDVAGSNPKANKYGGYVSADVPTGWRAYYYGPISSAESNPVFDPEICPE